MQKIIFLKLITLLLSTMAGGLLLASCSKKPDSPYSPNAVEQAKEFAKNQSRLANEAALAKHPLSQVKVNIEPGQPDFIQGKTMANTE